MWFYDISDTINLAGTNGPDALQFALAGTDSLGAPWFALTGTDGPGAFAGPYTLARTGALTSALPLAGDATVR
jgi:hypothetical protein